MTCPVMRSILPLLGVALSALAAPTDPVEGIWTGTVIRHTGGVMALDRRTGQVKWQYRSALPMTNGFGGCAGSLALAEGCVISAGFDGRLLAWPVP